MNIAILGATSQIARDLICSFANHGEYQLTLFARGIGAVNNWLSNTKLAICYDVKSYDEFNYKQKFDVIINFVGVGDPVKVVAMGKSIFDTTLHYDNLALSYIQQYSDCRYIFLSSGAVYGSDFAQPVNSNSDAIIPLNCFQPQDWYGMAKLYAECRHRALPQLSIVDVRVFNYFSSTIDISSRFFISDVLRAIQSGDTLVTSKENIVRDYLGPDDFYKLVSLILESPVTNDAIDCYTKAPIDKIALLLNMQKYFGLKYEFQKLPVGVNATGVKLNYFSQNFKASTFGYSPSFSSLETLNKELGLMISSGILKSANKLKENYF